MGVVMRALRPGVVLWTYALVSVVIVVLLWGQR